MSDTSGHTSATPLAHWDRASSCWRMSQATFLSEDQPSLGSLPTSGFVSDGWLYEQPMSAPATDELESSSLPTPTATYAGGDHKDFLQRKIDSGAGATVTDLRMVVEQLLPTPTTDDANNTTRASGDFQSLARVAHNLLPTPTSADSRSSGGYNPAWGHGLTLTDFARSVSTPEPSHDTNEPSDD